MKDERNRYKHETLVWHGLTVFGTDPVQGLGDNAPRTCAVQDEVHFEFYPLRHVSISRLEQDWHRPGV